MKSPGGALFALLVYVCRRCGWLVNLGHAFDALIWWVFKWRLNLSSKDSLISTRMGSVRTRVCLPGGLVVKAGKGLLTAYPSAIILIPDAPVFVEHTMDACQQLATELKQPVVVFDLPGFGLSRATASYNHTLKSARQVIEDVVQHLGVPRVYLHGSCVTGLYCLAYAQAAGKGTCLGVVVGNTPNLPDLKHWADVTVKTTTLFIPFLGQLMMRLLSSRLVVGWFWFKWSVPKATKDRSDRIRQLSATSHICLDEGGGCWCFAGVLQGVYYDPSDDDAVAMIPRDIPVVNLWGPGDRSHVEAGTVANSLETLVPHAKTVVLPDDAGHAPGIERPDLLVEAFRDLLTSRSPDSQQLSSAL